jgi:hypothetical protein
MPDKFNIVSPDGRIIQGTQEELARLQLLGNYKAEDIRDTRYRRGEAQTEADYSTFEDKAKTFGMGALSGLSLGLADPLLNTDEEDLRAKYNPGSRLAGEIVGGVAPALIPGGEFTAAGALSRGAEGIGSAILERTGSKLAGKVATGVLEGGAAGFQAEMSNAQLSNDPVTAERLVHGVGMGVLFGAGLTAGLHGLGVGLEKVGNKLETKPTTVTRTLHDEIQIVNEDNFAPFRANIREVAGVDSALQTRIDTELEKLKQTVKQADTVVPPEKLVHEQPPVNDPFKIPGVPDVESPPDAFLNRGKLAAPPDELAARRALTPGQEAAVKAGAVPTDATRAAFAQLAETKAPDAAKIPVTDLATAQQKLESASGELGSYLEMTKAKDAAKSVRALRQAARAASEAIKNGDSVRGLAALERFTEAIGSVAAPVNYSVTELIDEAMNNVYEKMNAKAEPVVAAAATKTTDAQIAEILAKPKGKRASPIGDIRKKNAADIAAEKLKREQMRTALAADQMAARKLRLDAQKAKYIETVKNAAGTTVEPYIKTQAAVKELSNFPNTAKEFAGMQTKKTEAMLAAIEHIMKQDLPELVPLQQSLRSSVDSLMQSTGVKVDGPITSQLRKIQEIAHSANTIKVAREVDELVYKDKHHAGGVAVDGARWAAGHAFAKMTGSPAGYFVGSRLVGTSLNMLAGVQSAVQQRLSKAAKSIGRGLQSTRTKFVVPSLEPLYTKLDGSRDPEKNMQKAARNRITEMTEVAPHASNVLYKSVQQMVGSENTDIAAAMLDSAVKSFQSFVELLPKPTTNVISGFKPTWEPTPIESVVTAKMMEAFFNPLGTIEKMLTSGEVDAIQMETLQACVPEMVQETRNQVVMNADFENMSYANQEAFSIFLGQPISSTFDPMNFVDAQSTHNKVPGMSGFNPSGSSAGNKGGRPPAVEPPTTAQQTPGGWA